MDLADEFERFENRLRLRYASHEWLNAPRWMNKGFDFKAGYRFSDVAPLVYNKGVAVVINDDFNREIPWEPSSRSFVIAQRLDPNKEEMHIVDMFIHPYGIYGKKLTRDMFVNLVQYRDLTLLLKPN